MRILRPTPVEPVNMIMSATSTSAAPVPPDPTATWRTSGGSPHSRIASAISSDVSGVTLDGLSTTALPAASAGMQSPKLLMSG